MLDDGAGDDDDDDDDDDDARAALILIIFFRFFFPHSLSSFIRSAAPLLPSFISQTVMEWGKFEQTL